MRVLNVLIGAVIVVCCLSSIVCAAMSSEKMNPLISDLIIQGLQGGLEDKTVKYTVADIKYVRSEGNNYIGGAKVTTVMGELGTITFPVTFTMVSDGTTVYVKLDDPEYAFGVALGNAMSKAMNQGPNQSEKRELENTGKTTMSANRPVTYEETIEHDSRGNAIATEQILKVKGLYIGMNIDEACPILSKLLGISLKVKECNEREQMMACFDRSIKVKYVIWCYEGLTTIIIYAGEDKKINRIMFPNYIVDKLFNVSGVNAQDFAKQFASGYKLPEMKTFSDNYGQGGWEYTSANGYIVQIYDSKTLFITKFPKKNEMKFD